MSTRPSITASIRVNRQEVATEINVPLRKSVTNPDRYDLIASLQEVPALKKYKFSRIGVQEYEHNLDSNKRSGFYQAGAPFNSSSPENLLTLREVEQFNDLHYGEKFRNEISRRLIYTLHLDNSATTGLKCAMCHNEAHLLNTLNETVYCSYVCLEK